jgi:CelD/BcsL family acetyltransferase involved in cellulose biosynthesis
LGEEFASEEPDAPLEISTITTGDGLRSLAGDWARLHSRAQNVRPFQLPTWLATWWDAFRQDRPLLRDSLHVKVVRRQGTVVGILPFMLSERPRSGPIRARALGFLGTDEYVTEQRAPVYDRHCQAEVASAIAAHLMREPHWDWIRWDGLDRESEFARTLESTMPLRWGQSEIENLLPLKPSWEEFRSGLKRNIKESLRHCYNSLKRDGFAPRLHVAERPDEVEAALRTFFSLHTARASAAAGAPHPDRFATPASRRFLVDVCRTLAAEDIARVFTLEVDGDAVASRIGFVLPGVLYLYYSGFYPAWGKYSVMTTAVAEIVKYAIDRRIPLVHLSMGADVSKSRWGGPTATVHEAISVRPAWRSEAALDLYEWGRTQRLGGFLARLLPKRRFD